MDKLPLFSLRSISTGIQKGRNMKLIQEKYQDRPWLVLIASILLKNSNSPEESAVIEEVIDKLIADYPTVEEFRLANQFNVSEILADCGQRSAGGYLLINIQLFSKWSPTLSHEIMIRSLSKMGQVNQYVIDSFRMVALGHRDFWPKNPILAARMMELRYNPQMYKDHNCRPFLGLVESCGFVFGIGRSSKSQVMEIQKHSAEVLKTWVNIVDPKNPPHTVCEKWLATETSYGPAMTAAAKELIMTIIGINAKGKITGKFGDKASASAVSTEVVTTEDLQGMKIEDLTRIYNILVGPEKAIKKFADKATGLKRTTDAMDGFTNTVPAEKKKAAKKEKDPNAPKSGRDLMRDFLTKDKLFKVEDIAALLNTTNGNAGTGINLLKTRPGKGFHALVTEKQADGFLKVIQAPCAETPETPVMDGQSSDEVNQGGENAEAGENTETGENTEAGEVQADGEEKPADAE